MAAWRSGSGSIPGDQQQQHPKPCAAFTSTQGAWYRALLCVTYPFPPTAAELVVLVGLSPAAAAAESQNSSPHCDKQRPQSPAWACAAQSWEGAQRAAPQPALSLYSRAAVRQPQQQQMGMAWWGGQSRRSTPGRQCHLPGPVKQMTTTARHRCKNREGCCWQG